MKRVVIIMTLLPALFLSGQRLSAQEFKKEVTIGWAGNTFGDQDMLLPYNDGMYLSSNPLDYI